MTSLTEGHARPVREDGDAVGTTTERPVRPVGTWVVAGFLLFAILTMWTLVSIVFQVRS